MNHFCPINFKVYHDPKYRYRFWMTELNYDTLMCEYGLHSYKIQFPGKSEYTSPCMLVLNQRWRRVWTNQKFASLVCSPTHFFLWSSEEIPDGGKMFIETQTKYQQKLGASPTLIRIFLKTEIFFAVLISLPSVPTALSKTQVFENVLQSGFF